MEGGLLSHLPASSKSAGLIGHLQMFLELATPTIELKRFRFSNARLGIQSSFYCLTLHSYLCCNTAIFTCYTKLDTTVQFYPELMPKSKERLIVHLASFLEETAVTVS